MRRKLKVYGWSANCESKATAALGDAPHIRQCRAIVAAPSLAEAARINGAKGPWQLFNLCETSNAIGIGVAMADPGVIYIASMQGGPRTFGRYQKHDVTIHGRIS